MHRILIIEDEPSIADLERDFLEMNGYEVDVEHRGDTGLNRALTRSYDLILLDEMLPQMGGFEICRKIRREKNTPIIFVTARKEDIDKVRGLGLGADDYMVKPFSPNEMVARVKAHISRYERLLNSAEPKDEALCIRGLRLEKLSRRVYVQDEEVPFTTKEFDLLSFLVSNPNRVYSKEELFERIWGADALGDLNTVTVHIRKLREKIESDRANPQYIETIWGAGYRFKP
ncbi:response regulator transcription factor [Paenibacillus aurantius]|uniref:Response regulator transcription factor n=1 Tax=Paenibacillus aurantius TaxID=2918900 RepID=A0AA96LIE2_9BACL|nr:response regulator transcription factor [Paenibacillus aurantius]WNQ12526.1 response regulator transcription factor [Paenibacillus aurantius]